MLVFVVILPNCRLLRFCTTSLATGTPPWLLRPVETSTLATFGCSIFARLFRHSFTASATVLTRRFLPRGVVYLALLPQVGQMVEFGHFGQIVECSFTN